MFLLNMLAQFFEEIKYPEDMANQFLARDLTFGNRGSGDDTLLLNTESGNC